MGSMLFDFIASLSLSSIGILSLKGLWINWKVNTIRITPLHYTSYIYLYIGMDLEASTKPFGSNWVLETKWVDLNKNFVSYHED